MRMIYALLLVACLTISCAGENTAAPPKPGKTFKPETAAAVTKTEVQPMKKISVDATPFAFAQKGLPSIKAMDMTPDGKYLLSTDEKDIVLWDMETGRELTRALSPEGVVYLSFIGSGERYFTLSVNGNVTLMETYTNHIISTLNPGAIGYLSDPVTYFDGSVFTYLDATKMISVDVRNMRLISKKERPNLNFNPKYIFQGFGRKAAFSDHGRLLLTAGMELDKPFMDSKDLFLLYWDPSAGRLIKMFTGHKESIDIVAASDDGRWAISADGTETKFWDLRKTRELMSVKNEETPDVIMFSDDSRYAVVAHDKGNIQIFDMSSGKMIKELITKGYNHTIKFSGDMRSIILGQGSEGIKVVDFAKMAVTAELKGMTDRHWDTAISADRRYALTKNDGTITCWELSTGRPAGNIKIGSSITDAVFMPDSEHIAVSANGCIEIHNISTGGTVKTIDTGKYSVSKLTVSPDGSMIIAARGKNAELYSVKSGNAMHSFPLEKEIKSLGFSINSKNITLIYRESDKVNKADTYDLTYRLINTNSIYTVSSFSSDGRYAVPSMYEERKGDLFGDKNKPDSNKNNLRVIDPATDKEAAYLIRKLGIAYMSVAYDGYRDVALIRYINEKDSQLINPATGEVIRNYPIAFGILTRDAGKILVPDKEAVALFSAKDMTRLYSFENRSSSVITSLAVTEDGRYAAAGRMDGSIDFWSFDDGKFLRTLHPAKNPVLSITFSPKTRYMAVQPRFEKLKILDLSQDGAEVFSTESYAYPKNYDSSKEDSIPQDYGMDINYFSRDERFLSNSGGSIDIQARRVIDKPYDYPMTCYTPDGRYIIKGNKILTYGSNQLVRQLPLGMPDRIVLSPDGKRIYAAGGETMSFGGCSLTAVSIETGKILYQWREVDGAQYVDVSADGKMALLISMFGNLTTWNLATGERLHHMTIDENIRSAYLTGDGNKILINTVDSLVMLDLNSGKELAKYISFSDGEWVSITPQGYYSSSAEGDKYINVRRGWNIYSIDNYREAFFRPDLVSLSISGETLGGFKSLADAKEPPSIKISTASERVSGSTAQVQVVLKDNGGGIGDVRLYLNGTSVIMDSSRAMKAVKDAGTSESAYEIKLMPGENVIKAVAFESTNSVQSNPAMVKVFSDDVNIRKPVLHAIVIGINDYKNPRLNLSYAAPDAKLFAEALGSVSASLFESVDIITLTKTEETSRENIVSQLEKMKQLNPQDVFVFYVASHGTVDDGEYFLITSNVGSLRTDRLRQDALPQTILKDLIANIPTTKKLIVIDTCNAGKLGEELQVAMMTRGMSEDTALKILSRAVGSTILSASTSIQEALEGYHDHGLFTYVLVEGLKGAAIQGGKGMMRTIDLADYVEMEVPDKAEKVFKRAQYPTISISGQTFPLGLIK